MTNHHISNLDQSNPDPASDPIARPHHDPAGVRRIARHWVAVGAVAISTVIIAPVVGATTAAATNSAIDQPDAAALRPVAEMASEAVVALDAYRMTGDRSGFVDYVRLRADVARGAAREIGYGEFDMIVAWSEAPLDHQRAVLAALTQLGLPYRTNTSIEGVAFDCSGLTSYAWRAAGTELFRNSSDQIRNSAERTRETAVAGDLVQYPGHVMMFLGVGDAIVHSITHGRPVSIDTISSRRASSVRFGDPTG